MQNKKKSVILRSIKLIFLMVFVFSLTLNAQWQKFDAGTQASFRGLDVVNKKVIWASGTGGTFIRTTDGGKTWKTGQVKGAEKLDFRDIEAFDENTAYVLSIGNGENSRIYKTTDGGESWKLQFKNTIKDAFFDSIAFWDEKHGLAQSDPVGGKYVFYATNDGETWQQLSPENMPSAKEGEAAFAASGTCIVTRGKNEVFLITGGKDARVFYSNDRGLSWEDFNTPMIKGENATGIFSIALNGKKRGVIVGGDYTKPENKTANIAYSNDGGKTWQTRLKENSFGYRSGATFVNKKTIVIVGTSGSDISYDGGETWESLDKENYNAVQSKGKKAVWAVGPKGMVARLLMKKR